MAVSALVGSPAHEIDRADLTVSNSVGETKPYLAIGDLAGRVSRLGSIKIGISFNMGFRPCLADMPDNDHSNKEMRCACYAFHGNG